MRGLAETPAAWVVCRGGGCSIRAALTTRGLLHPHPQRVDDPLEAGGFGLLGRKVALVVSEVRVCAVGEEEADDGELTEARGDVQRRRALRPHAVQVEPSADEHGDRVCVARACAGKEAAVEGELGSMVARGEGRGLALPRRRHHPLSLAPSRQRAAKSLA